MSCVNCVVKVFDMKFNSETWLEVMIHHHRSLCIENCRTSQTTSYCVIYKSWISAILYSQSKCF